MMWQKLTTNVLMVYQNSMKRWSYLGSPFTWRRILRPTGIIRQKSHVALCESDLEKLKNLTLHSVYLTHWCPPPGIPLSAVRMEVSKGPSIEITKLAPSLVPFLEAAAANGFQDNGPKHKAFEVLEKALVTLTKPNISFGLSWEVLRFLDELHHVILTKIKVSKEKKTVTEAEVHVNVAIVNHILQHLTSGLFILNRGSEVLSRPKRTYHPEMFRLGGLTLGHRDAWYGEIDMLVSSLNSGHPKPNVAVLFEKYDEDCVDDAYEDEDDIEEGFSDLDDPTNWSLFGSHFSQGFATAVAFSYVYHYKLSESQSVHSSLLPTIQLSPRGYQIFLYDCVQDVMLANNFYWSRESMIYLWAFLHYQLFFPANLDLNLANCVRKFGYNQSAGFRANCSDLSFGLSKNSIHWTKLEPEEGRMV